MEKWFRNSHCAARKFWGLWAIERACPTQRLLGEPPLHSGYCGSLADTLSIHRPSPEPTTLPHGLIEFLLNLIRTRLYIERRAHTAGEADLAKILRAL